MNSTDSLATENKWRLQFTVYIESKFDLFRNITNIQLYILNLPVVVLAVKS